jgi:hypothetical protein
MVNSIQHHHRRELYKKGMSHSNKSRVSVQNSTSIFRRKYTTLLLVSIFGSVLFFMSVIAYNTAANYDLFKRLALTSNPDLVSYLERELAGLYVLYGAGLTSVFVFCIFVGYKMTKSISTTLHKLQKHFIKISNLDWSTNEFHYSLNDDHSDLLMNYAVFYRSLRANALKELQSLERIMNDSYEPHIKARIHELCVQNRKKLGLAEEKLRLVHDASVSKIVSPDATHEKRRVS